MADVRARSIPWVGNATTAVATLTATSNAELVAAQASGKKIYLHSLMVTPAPGVKVRADIKDGTTTRWHGYGAWSKTFQRPVPLTAATALNGALSAAASTGVAVSVEYSVDP